jgi:hypothetical protein
MGLISELSKAIRLLGSRRYTSGDLTTAQESFTSVLDVNASEIYSQQDKIPSSGLPFSGSADQYSVYQSGGENILKYWYRHPLTKSNVDRDVWFFVNPSGSDDGITPQLIDSNQQTNFVSNKYSAVSLANAVAEDITPGYNVVVYESTTTDSSSLSGGDKVSTNDYQFDYKTGVLQFDANKPGASDRIYMTAYQYVGKMMDTTITGVAGDSPFRLTGSYFSTAPSEDLRVSGSVLISGSLVVEGQTIMDSLDTDTKTLVVSGAMDLVDQTVGSAIASASFSISNLGTLATRDSAGIIDLGDGFS